MWFFSRKNKRLLCRRLFFFYYYINSQTRACGTHLSASQTVCSLASARELKYPLRGCLVPYLHSLHARVSTIYREGYSGYVGSCR